MSCGSGVASPFIRPSIALLISYLVMLAMFSGGKDVGASYQYMVTALTPGINVFTLQYRTGSSGTGTAKFRGITVVGV